jgi:hypothetical protein
MENKNWTIVKQAFVDEEILGITIVLEGQKVMLIGQVHEIDINNLQIQFDTSQFLQPSMPLQWEGINLYDISIRTLEDEIKVIEYSPELMVRTNQKFTPFHL